LVTSVLDTLINTCALVVGFGAVVAWTVATTAADASLGAEPARTRMKNTATARILRKIFTTHLFLLVFQFVGFAVFGYAPSFPERNC
jgi:hypothetical protein